MRNRDLRVHGSVQRAAEFVRANLAQLPELAPLSRRLDAHEKRLEPLVVDDESTRVTRDAGVGIAVTRAKGELRVGHLIPIARAAKRLMRFAPGVARAALVPPKRAATESLVRASRALVKAVRPGKKLFIEVGFPRDFIERCVRKTDQLAQHASHRGKGRAHRAVVVKALAEELRAARHTVELVDALLFERLRNDKPLGAVWRAASRVGQRMGRPLKSSVKAADKTKEKGADPRLPV